MAMKLQPPPNTSKKTDQPPSTVIKTMRKLHPCTWVGSSSRRQIHHPPTGTRKNFAHKTNCSSHWLRMGSVFCVISQNFKEKTNSLQSLLLEEVMNSFKEDKNGNLKTLGIIGQTLDLTTHLLMSCSLRQRRLVPKAGKSFWIVSLFNHKMKECTGI